MENFLHLGKVDHSSVFLGFFIGVIGFKPALQDLRNLSDFAFVHEFEGLFAQFRLQSALFDEHLLKRFISCEERLNCIDSNWYEVSPSNLSVIILVC